MTNRKTLYRLLTIPVLCALLLLTVSGPAGQADAAPQAPAGNNGIHGFKDGNVWWAEVYHNTRSASYRSPFGAVPTGQPITIVLRTADNDLSDATLVIYNINPSTDADGTADGTYWQVQSTPTSSSSPYAYYTFIIPAQPDARILYYKFRLQDYINPTQYDCDWYVDDYSHNSYDHEDRYENGSGKMVNGAFGNPCGYSEAGYDNNSFDITVYNASAYSSLEVWTQNAVIYQILPDRFRDGDPSNQDDWPYTDVYGTAQHLHTTWNEAVDDPRQSGGPYENKWSADFFGGDLQGIIDQLDYLKSIGVTALYLNPIFASPSNHGYDTSNYLQINPRYGSNALFQTLASESENRGIKIILDGVFNHTGSDSTYFDRYGRWDANGNASSIPASNSSGACESSGSTYASLFTFSGTSGPCRGNTSDYDSWWGYNSLPLLNENDAVKDLVFDSLNNDASPSAVIQYWYAMGADGWRFDVADEVSHDFWKAFRTQVKTTDALPGPLYSEVWYEATPWLLGDQMDATMNYRYRKAVLGFLIDSTWTDNDSNGDQTMWALSPSQFDYVLNSIREDYPDPSWRTMMNLMDSHDTNRALFVLREKSTDLSASLAKMKMMASLQFTYPGAPTIYYGDEVGLGARDYDNYGAWGAGKDFGSGFQDDPYNRAPYPWSDQSGTLPSGLPNASLRSHYQMLALARNNYDVLRTGDVTTLLTDDANKVYAYARTDGSAPDCAIAIFNRDANAHIINLTNLPTACADTTTTYYDVLNSAASYATSGTSLASITLNGLTSAVLVPRFDTNGATSLPPVSVQASSSARIISRGGNVTINATIRDVAGQTVPAGMVVNFTIKDGTGSLSSTTAATDSSGVASITLTDTGAEPTDELTVQASLQAPSGVTYSGSVTVLVGFPIAVTDATCVETSIGPQEIKLGSAVTLNKYGLGEPIISLATFANNPLGHNEPGSTEYVDVLLGSTTGVSQLKITLACKTACNPAADHIWWWDEAVSQWKIVSGSWGITESQAWFIVDGVSSPSLAQLTGTPVGAGSSSPTAVTVAEYGVRLLGSSNQVYWRTVLEAQTQGFNVYRSTSPDGPRTHLNTSQIPVQASGSLMGASYSFVDEDIQPDTVYYYWIEEVRQNGAPVFYGPLYAGPYGVYLPFIRR